MQLGDGGPVSVCNSGTGNQLQNVTNRSDCHIHVHKEYISPYYNPNIK